MPLHPQAKAFIDSFASEVSIDFKTVDACTLRALYDNLVRTSAFETGAAVWNRMIDGPIGPLRLRIYTPATIGPWPITLYFLGGGFTVGKPEQWDGICCGLARHAGSIVVSVDYRLAPEAKFPAATEDAKAALQWVYRHADELGGDRSRIAVAGDSSGGNLAAMLAQYARAQKINLAHQLLFSPALDAAGLSPSYRDMANGYGFTAEWMRWYWQQYLPDAEAGRDVRASPLLEADLAGLAPATIFTAEFDILRDEAEIYAGRLKAANVPTQLKRWPGQIHGFILMPDQFEDAEHAIQEGAAALREAFSS